MTKGLVLVAGAAGGRQGRTGRHVAEMLLARGVPVRAFVHRLDERSEHLRRLGAELFLGDLRDIASVQPAVQGVSSIYFAYPVQDGLLEAAAAMAVAAREAGVSRLVNLMMLRSSADAPTPRMRQNYLAEQIFGWAGVGAAHINAAVFYENIRALVAFGLETGGRIALPLGQDTTVVPLVSAEDVARVAVGLLTRSSVPSGSGYRLIGFTPSVRDIIAAFGQAYGRNIDYVAISDEEWRRDALARGADPHAVEHLSQLWRFFRLRTGSAGYERSDTIEMLGGAKPKSFEAFLREAQATPPAQTSRSSAS